ncbi:hypothetical protein KRR26_15510 [Corallococcus sp. M34]|uniref:hypothetical protein n=1 Tax=Citreicoccus inhibens TaxID=2849499 RepID=UPI001C21AB47|nr:hypothetical protein [Citreicoccus inhibens]MBU8897025.1 hypothetical protein [Citreicoccus inhibens]
MTSSGIYNSTYDAWMAFDGVDSTSSMWLSGLRQSPAWIGYEWTDGPRRIIRYAIRFVNGSTLTTRAPKDWTLQAWNGSQWVVVDTRTNEANWAGSERREYTLPANATYSKFRLNVTDDNDARTGIEVVSIGRLELLGCQPDTTPPVTPVLSHFSPASPSNIANPNLFGSAETGSTVRVYTNATCSGNPAVSVTAATENLFSAAVPAITNATTVFSVTATDPAGNVSGCSQPMSYVHDGTAPAAPVMTGFQPVSPSNSLTPQVRGTAEKGSTVQIFKSVGCVAPVVVSAVADASTGAFSAAVTVTANTTTGYSALAVDAAGNVSACSSIINYLHDNIAPAVPSLSGFLPVSPGNTLTPQLRGTAERGGTVQIFKGAGCVAPVVASAVADASTGAFSAPVTVGANTATSFSARVLDPAGNVSTCAVAVSYRHDSVAPPAPVFTPGFIPAEGNGTVGIVGASGEADSFITLFTDAACTTQFAPAGPFLIDPFGAVAVPLTQSQRAGPLFANARDVAGNRSGCVSVPVACDIGFADCDGNPANGCEVDLLSDEAHCGTCGTVCAGGPSAHAVCGAGTCGLGCVVGTFDCDGNPANGCESSTACAAQTCSVDAFSELMITNMSVVDDPMRTTADGVWTFGHLMREMNGGQDPSNLVRNWLKTWNTDQLIGVRNVLSRPNMSGMVLTPWESRSGGPGAPLDFESAPFRLLAIVNRMDLRKEGQFAGEGRFVFGVTDPFGSPMPFTVILEYVLPGGSPDEFQRWARDWHELGRIGVGNPGYNEKLEALTDRFTRSFVARGAYLGSAIHQVRSNENALNPFWELREFHLGAGGLEPAHVALTPDLAFNGAPVLTDFINQNMSSVLSESHTLPEFFGGQPVLAGSALTQFNFAWTVQQVPTEARFKFSVNTCSGCHSGDTFTTFLHVRPRSAGQASALSPFLLGTGAIPDRFDSSVTHSFADLARREADLSALVCGVPPANPLVQAKTSFGSSLLSGSNQPVRPAVPGFPTPSNLPPGRVH